VFSRFTNHWRAGSRSSPVSVPSGYNNWNFKWFCFLWGLFALGWMDFDSCTLRRRVCNGYYFL